MRDSVKIFKALSDSNRIRILKMLEIRPLCVCEITDVLQLANSTVSKHLSILRDSDLIIDSKSGKWVDYSLNHSLNRKDVSQILSLIKQWLLDDQLIQQDARRVESVNRNLICGT